MPLWSRRARHFWPVLAVTVLADCASKKAVVASLDAAGGSRPVIGDWLQLSLAYNRSSAMGLIYGAWARGVLAVAAIVALAALWRLYLRTAPSARLQSVAIALVAAGAFGNLLDRLRWNRGVVDFIDVGVGQARFWIFNVADVGIVTGVVLLAWGMTRPSAVQATE